MQPLPIVKQLDVVKQLLRHLGFGLRDASTEVIEAFGFDRGPEGFSQSVVVQLALRLMLWRTSSFSNSIRNLSLAYWLPLLILRGTVKMTLGERLFRCFSPAAGYAIFCERFYASRHNRPWNGPWRIRCLPFVLLLLF